MDKVLLLLLSDVKYFDFFSMSISAFASNIRSSSLCSFSYGPFLGLTVTYLFLLLLLLKFAQLVFFVLILLWFSRLEIVEQTVSILKAKTKVLHL